MKYFKLFFIWLISSFLWGSCQCDNAIQPTGGYETRIFYKNSKGEDLLDASTIGHLDPYNIRIDGKAQYVTGESIPKGGYNAHYIGFIMRPPTTTYLVTLSGIFSDTIRCIYKDNSLTNCSYNKINAPLQNGINEVLIEVTK